ncbi:UNVERIFIED_CONTAM: hypothetical protein NCL1_20780 [Trichonephila clavipes]
MGKVRCRVLFLLAHFIMQSDSFQDCDVPHQNLNELKSRVSSKMGVLLVPKGPYRSVCANSISKETGQCDKEEGLVQGRNYVYIEEFPIRPQYREMDENVLNGLIEPIQCQFY